MFFNVTLCITNFKRRGRKNCQTHRARLQAKKKKKIKIKRDRQITIHKRHPEQILIGVYIKNKYISRLRNFKRKKKKEQK